MTQAELDRADNLEAVSELLDYCRELETDRDFTPLSARQGLAQCGHTDRAFQDQVLRAIADNGFHYCLDPIIPHRDGSTPPRYACAWGADQLRSRLHSVVSRLRYP